MTIRDKRRNLRHEGALEWWKKWRDFIFQAIELSFKGD